MATYDSSPVSLTAAADLSTKLYYFGKMSSTGIALCSVAGERADGVIGSKPSAAGDGMDLWIDRVIPVMCGGSVSVGDSLTTNASGKAVVATSGQAVNGIALEAGSDGAVVKMLRPLSAAVSGGYQALSASGALTPTADTVLLSVSGTKAYTLADGNVGHELEIVCVAAASTPLGTLTIATCFNSESTTHVFTAVGQRLLLVMTATGWHVVNKSRAGSLTVVVGTDVLTGYDMVETYNLSITDTVTSTTTKGLPNGQVPGEFMAVRCTTAAGTPAGNIDGNFLTLAGAAATHLAVNNTGDYAIFRWDGSAWANHIVNSITLS